MVSCGSSTAGGLLVTLLVMLSIGVAVGGKRLALVVGASEGVRVGSGDALGCTVVTGSAVVEGATVVGSTVGAMGDAEAANAANGDVFDGIDRFSDGAATVIATLIAGLVGAPTADGGGEMAGSGVLAVYVLSTIVLRWPSAPCTTPLTVTSMLPASLVCTTIDFLAANCRFVSGGAEPEYTIVSSDVIFK